jgi:hypothetical protein
MGTEQLLVRFLTDSLPNWKKQAVPEFNLDSIFPFAGACAKSVAIFLLITNFYE